MKGLPMLLCAAVIALVIVSFENARQPVRIARYLVHASNLPCALKPFRMVVIGDLHVSKWTTPPARIVDAVKKANAQRPDLVLLVGDYFGRNWPQDDVSRLAALKPLRDLRPRIATVAIMGNNDFTDGSAAITEIMTNYGVKVLDNDAMVTPEVVVMGMADITSDTANPKRAIERYESARAELRIAKPHLEIWLAHNPAMFDRLSETGDVLFAGHTHGGQVLPQITVPVMHVVVRILRQLGFKASWPAEKFVRGYYHVGHKRMIVTSGVGTSGLPFRMGVPPEIALVTMSGC